ncbi:hypothetical protein TEA_001185 [Camellia sinensis var. sinensis]|uniref:WAT1-related protein n=1 Tax=Camellia sinensis var. sinensis TaxID=542762 RepID=A0A4S4E4D1_CAMSN|nr:hypothetical protein TEA_001185 [Camellia sinensis var. sinensis]
MVVTLFGCIFVTILSAIVALIVERDPNAWTLKPDVELITIVYSAVFMVSIRSVIYAWVCRIKGPVFVSTFRPLGMAFAVFMGVTFLKDTLHIGSVIGAVTIALGLYAVMWGKANEVQIIEENVISRVDSSSDKVPLLQNKSMEVGPECRFTLVKVVTRSMPRCDSRGIFGCSKPLPIEWETEAKVCSMEMEFWWKFLKVVNWLVPH